MKALVKHSIAFSSGQSKNLGHLQLRTNAAFDPVMSEMKKYQWQGKDKHSGLHSGHSAPMAPWFWLEQVLVMKFILGQHLSTFLLSAPWYLGLTFGIGMAVCWESHFFPQAAWKPVVCPALCNIYCSHNVNWDFGLFAFTRSLSKMQLASSEGIYLCVLALSLMIEMAYQNGTGMTHYICIY